MAYVAISQELKDAIRSTLNNLKAVELNTAKAPEPYIEEQIKADPAFCAECQALVLDKMWEGMEDIRAIAGDRLNKVKAVAYVAFDTTLEDGTFARLSSAADVFPPSAGWPAFAVEVGTYNTNPRVTVKVPYTHPVFKQAYDNLSVRKECSDRWDGVINQVTKFIESCKSLNEALKLWPDIEKYVPKQYMERVNKKSERSKASESDAAKALAQIDMNAVAASVTLARMAGGKL